MFRLILVFLFIASTLGCSSLQGFLFPDKADKDTTVSWEKDLRMQVHDKVYYGTAVVPERESYTIYIFPPYQNITRLQWRTCHRGGAAKDAVQNGKWPWSKKEKYFKMQYVPKDIERERACALKFEALAKDRKSIAFGMIAFPDLRPWFDVPSTVECNGEVNLYFDGTSMCQAPVNAITRISFNSEIYMDMTDNVNCPPFKEIAKGIFEFKMPKDECVYNFKKAEEHKESGKLRSHKLITFGFEKTPPQEDY